MSAACYFIWGSTMYASSQVEALQGKIGNMLTRLPATMGKDVAGLLVAVLRFAGSRRRHAVAWFPAAPVA
jgi:hypothetical protein